MQIDFDPAILTYEQLLALFWKWHSPNRPSLSRQYMSAILYHDAHQKVLAEKSLQDHERRSPGKVYTLILPLERLYLAEEYHQKYYLRRHHRGLALCSRIYSRPDNFINATLAARANGFVAGYGDAAEFAQEIGLWGLEAEDAALLGKLLVPGEVVGGAEPRRASETGGEAAPLK